MLRRRLRSFSSAMFGRCVPARFRHTLFYFGKLALSNVCRGIQVINRASAAFEAPTTVLKSRENDLQPVRVGLHFAMPIPTKSKLDLATLSAIPHGIWALGFVSLLMDISSEMVHALLPIYLVTVLGATALTVGTIEGIAEATASIVKIFSGALSDWLGKRKLLVVLGYGLAAFTKPVFPLAPTVGSLVAARFIDRIGKGIRGAPRDALVADISPEHLRGASFGLRQSLDTIGAFVGPMLAIFLMWFTANNFKIVF